jgi:Tfp pilus assembly protein PilF
VNEALVALDEAIARDPDDAVLHHTYGTYCLLSGRLPQAVKSFERALALDPHFTDVHNTLGTAYLEQKDFQRAESEFRTALADPAYPTPEKVYLNLGLLYLEQGRDKEAIDALRMAVAIDPKYYKAHFHLAATLDRVGELAEAAQEYEVAEPAFRSDGVYWYRRGFAYYRLGQKQKALESLTRVRVVSPGSESAARAEELLGVLK